MKKNVRKSDADLVKENYQRKGYEMAALVVLLVLTILFPALALYTAPVLLLDLASPWLLAT